MYAFYVEVLHTSYLPYSHPFDLQTISFLLLCYMNIDGFMTTLKSKNHKGEEKPNFSYDYLQFHLLSYKCHNFVLVCD